MFEIEEEYWWYRGLRVLLEGLIAQYVPRDHVARVLDAGCGTGANLQQLRRYADAWGVDISEQAIQFCRRRNIPANRVLVASLLELPFPDEFFELAFSFDVICNIQHDVSAFAELQRVLVPGGRVLVQVPAYRFLWSAHDVAVGHKYRYTAGELRAKITRAGFRVEALTYLNMTLLPLIALVRLARRTKASHDVRSDLAPLPRPMNELLARMFSTEIRCALHLMHHAGVSKETCSHDRRPLPRRADAHTRRDGQYARRRVAADCRPALRLPFGLSLFVVARK